jgi:predicted metal-dependent hydrolase
MFNRESNHIINDIEFTIIYSRRRTLAISIKPDATVIVRVPNLTTYRTISRIVSEKADWIRKHRNNYSANNNNDTKKRYCDGEMHLFRGAEHVLKIAKSSRSYIRFSEGNIEAGLLKTDDPAEVKKILYRGYKNEAAKQLPLFFADISQKLSAQGFKPSGLIIRTMKRRWGSCSGKGLITLSTELIKLSDIYIEYVIIHELCHLKHHNHGAGYYRLLSELFPDWKKVRRELKQYINH